MYPYSLYTLYIAMIPSIPLNDTALTIFEVTAPGAVLTIKALRSVSTQHPNKQMTTCQAARAVG